MGSGELVLDELEKNAPDTTRHEHPFYLYHLTNCQLTAPIQNSSRCEESREGRECILPYCPLWVVAAAPDQGHQGGDVVHKLEPLQERA